MNGTTPCLLCSVALGALAATASPQARDASHHVLARPRAQAEAHDQRLLLLLAGGDAAAGAALAGAMTDYRDLGKLLRYEYRVVALPAASRPGAALRERLRLGGLALPALAVLGAGDEVLATLGAERMAADGSFAPERVRGFLEEHAPAPRHAREVLAEGLAAAKESGRRAFVYLSAPW